MFSLIRTQVILLGFVFQERKTGKQKEKLSFDKNVP